MFSVNPARTTGPRSVNAVRTIRTKRRADYIRAPVTIPQPDRKSHDGPLRRQLKAFLGPKNIRGEYYQNKHYYPPQDNRPRYINPRQSPVVTPGAEQNEWDSFSRNPFPNNPHTKTAQVLSDDLKQRIFTEIVEKGSHPQQVAHKYGIRLPRVEAVVKLQHIEKQWRNDNLINDDLEKYAKVMGRMFPVFSSPQHRDNLTEIPTPSKTLHQRFLTISESEPFGPVDAAKIFGLEPAQETLDKLAEFKEVDETTQTKLNTVVVGVQKEGDDVQFRFTKATSGEVGYRYGASRRDRKRNRAVGFDKVGHMVYTV